MKKRIALSLIFVCSLALLSNFSLAAQIGNLSDQATLAFLGFGLLTVTFFVKRALKT
jgi:hypothetical protein